MSGNYLIIGGICMKQFCGRRTWLAVIGALSLTASLHAGELLVLKPAAARIQIDKPGVELQATRLEKALETRDIPSLSRQLTEIRRGQLGPVAQDYLLRKVAEGLQRMPWSGGAEQLAHSLTLERPRVHVVLSDGGYQQEMPLYQVASAARGALTLWATEKVRSRAQTDLESGRLGLVLDEFQLDTGADKPGLQQALATASPAQLGIFIDQIRDHINSPDRADLAAIAAMTLPDTELLESLYRHFASLDLQKSLHQLEGFESDQRLRLLLAALDNPLLAGRAIAELGKLAGGDQYLMPLLADPQLGGAAAQALAGAPSNAVIAALEDLARRHWQQPAGKRALLALKLSGTPSARRFLAEFAQSDDITPALRKELSQWQ